MASNIKSNISYEIRPGFESYCGNNETYTYKLIDSTSSYVPNCKGMNLLRHHFQPTNNGMKFDAHKFLSLLSNKRLAVIGDSVGLQLFQAIENALVCEETFRFDGNNNVTRVRYHGRWTYPARLHHLAAIRDYHKYNARILFCIDNFLDVQRYIHSNPHHEGMYGFCGNDTVMSDYIIIAIGAHYKPLYYNKTANYYEDLENSAHLLYTHGYEFRTHVAQYHPDAVIIWRLIPHSGNHDELVYKSEVNKTNYDKRLHWNGHAWMNTKEDAIWVSKYNAVISKLAMLYNDVILDWYTLSHVALDYFRQLKTPLHSDSVHYCADGLPRLSMALLQDILVNKTN